MKAVFFVLLCCLLVVTSKSYSKSSSTLNDSLYTAIQTETSYQKMDALLSSIRKYRKKLGENYIPLLKQYAQKAKNIGYVKGEMKSYDFIGLEYRYDEKFDAAYLYHTKSLELAIQEKDSAQLVYNYNNLGQVFRKQDITALAIDYFHKAIEISDAVGNLRSLSYSMNALGTALTLQKDYDRAMSYFQQSSAIARQRNDNRTLAYNYGSMGEIFLIKEQVDSAMYYFQTSRDILVQTKSYNGIGVAAHLIGKAYLAKEDYKNAKQQFELALEYHQKDENLRYQALCNSYLGKIAIAEKNYTVAEEYLNLAILQATKVSSLKNIMEAYSSYAELYQQQNQWKNAFNALQQSHFYADSILNERSNKTIQALEIEFETKKKEQQIELLEAENLIKNQRFVVSIATTVVVILILIIGVLLYLKKRKKNQIYQLVLRQQLLRSQMNPHFLFNALGSIQNFMYKNETKKAASYLGNFASLTRSILEHSAAEFVPLSAEIETLHNYVKLEQMRAVNSFEYKIEYDEDLDTEFINVPPMLIQPFVENAVKHGLKNIDYPGFLSVQFCEIDDKLQIRITDNGHGINTTKTSDKKAKAHRSMSMQIFKERRAILSQRFKKDINFELIDRNDQNKNESGTEVLIVIPV